MDDDVWNLGLSTSSREYLGSDQCFDYDEVEEDEDEVEEVCDAKEEYHCPYCLEDFDLVGLCCHIDEEHAVEAASGVCPFCSVTVGMNMVGHMTSKHGDMFNVRRKLKLVSSTLTSSRKDSLDGRLQSFLGVSSPVFSSSNIKLDPSQSAFAYNLPTDDSRETAHPGSLTELNFAEKSSDQSISKRDAQPSSSSEGQASSFSSVEDQGEKVRRCEFVQGLLCSSFLDDSL